MNGEGLAYDSLVPPTGRHSRKVSPRSAQLRTAFLNQNLISCDLKTLYFKSSLRFPSYDTVSMYSCAVCEFSSYDVAVVARRI